MKKLLAVAACLLQGVFLIPVTGTEDKQPDQFIVVGSWNIQWLGNAAQRPGKLPAQKPEDLVDYILASKADLLAIQEITDDDGDPDTYTNKTLTEVVKLLNKQSGHDWDHVLMPKPTAPNVQVDQLCGVLWNKKKVSKKGNPFEVPVPRNKGKSQVWKRHPHAVKFSFGDKKTDVVLISVHLKSNKDGVVAGTDNREKEAKSFIEKLPEVKKHFQDEDIILVGDTNFTGSTEPGIAILKMAFKDLNDTDVVTSVRKGEPFDRFFVPPDQPEFKGSTQEVFRDAYLASAKIKQKNFLQRYSDHYMITTKVRIMDDDD